jgi:hypothetical protein
MSEEKHVHDCTGPDMRCPCGFVFRIPPISVSFEVYDSRRKVKQRTVLSDAFNCDSFDVVIDALRRAASRLEREK